MASVKLHANQGWQAMPDVPAFNPSRVRPRTHMNGHARSGGVRGGRGISQLR